MDGNSAMRGYINTGTAANSARKERLPHRRVDTLYKGWTLKNIRFCAHDEL